MGRPRKPTIWHELDDCYIAVLKHGETAISKKDFSKVNSFRWFTKLSKATGKYYVYSHLIGDKKILLHRHILDIDDHRLVDHKNGDTLDNRQENLRVATRLENNRNVKKRKNCKSKYKGLTLQESGKWSVSIQIPGKKLYLGTYDNEKTAALVYNQAAIKYFGEFAKLNKLEE